jgi:hypothetical protein
MGSGDRGRALRGESGPDFISADGVAEEQISLINEVVIVSLNLA